MDIKEMIKRKEKKGQVTIFIILAIIILAGIGIMFFVLLKGSDVSVETPQSLGPKGFIEKCVQEVVEGSIEKVMNNGGTLDQTFNVTYKGQDYRYLCYQNALYETCYNLQPMFKQEIISILEEDTSEGVKECFNVMREDFENRGYDVTGESTNYSLEIYPGEIRIRLSKPMTIANEQDLQEFEKFNTKITSSTYDIIRITKLIIKSEQRFCYFESAGYMIGHPEYDISWKEISDGSKIYEVRDRQNNESLKFAVRGCALPIGMF